MDKFANELDQIVVLYHTLDFSNDNNVLSEITNKNTCENILAIVQSILKIEPTHAIALLWKVQINGTPIYEDTSSIQEDCNLIINTSSDITSKLKAYDWLVYIYEEKLSLTELAIETLQNKLIDVANIKDDRSLQDQVFGDTYHKLAHIYKAKGEENQAIDYYLKSFNYAPKTLARNYDGGLLLLEHERFDEAAKLLAEHFELAEPIQSKVYAKEIETLFNDGKLGKHWNYSVCFIQQHLTFL